MSTLGPAAFTVESQSGSSSYLDWSLSGTQWGPTTLWKWRSKVYSMSIPTGISSIDDGSQFESLKVTYNAYYSGPTAINHYAYLTGGSTKSHALTTSSTGYTLDGDKMYWGLSGTVSEIFTGLKSGTIKFNYWQGTATGGGISGFCNTVRATLTYTTPDTKRASIIVTLP